MNGGKSMEMSSIDYLKRQKILEDLISDNNAKNLKQHKEFLTSIFAITSSTSNLSESLNSGKIFSIETLLDAIIILYDECSTSSLRREKSVSDFVDMSKIYRHGENASKTFLILYFFYRFSEKSN